MEAIYQAVLSIVGIAIITIVIHVVLHTVFHIALYSNTVTRVIGVLTVSAGIYFALISYQQLQDMPEHPENVSIKEIPKWVSIEGDHWVSIHDGIWDCSNAVYNGEYTYAVLMSGDQSVIIAAVFDEEKTCEELMNLVPSGSLAEFEKREYIYTSNYIDFSRYASSSSVFSFCGYCGRSNSQLGVVMGMVFAVLGLSYDKLMRRGRVRQIDTAIHPRQQRDLTN